MHLGNVPLEQAVGAVLVHNIVGTDGRKVLSKGRVVRADDLATLKALGKETVYAAILEPGDIREDEAAERLARLVAGNGIDLSKPSGGRVNFYSTERGFLRVDDELLRRINALPGIALATIPRYSPVMPKKMVATLKTIGLALPGVTVAQAEQVVREGGTVFSITAIGKSQIALILTGSANGQARVREVFAPPIRARVEELGAQIISEQYVAEDEGAIAGAIRAALDAGAQLVILAGETSIMDAEDISPRGIRRAGGGIELFGAPVEPGNLTLLAYCGAVPIIGAPGCIKSRETNAVDLILPRLLAGDRVTRADVIALADGGLLVG